MKKIFFISFSALSVLFCATVFSAEKTITTTKPAPIAQSAPAVVEKKAPEIAIHLYESPEVTAKIIKTLPASARLVAIIQKGDWMKVGDQQDGSTGWINLSQYHQVKKQYYQRYFQTNFETVFVHTYKDNNGKTVIEAYRDGKKLSEDEAKKLYEKSQAEAHKQWEGMQQFNRMLDHEMHMDLISAKRQFDEAFGPTTFFMPGMVVIEKPVEKKSVNKNS